MNIRPPNLLTFRLFRALSLALVSVLCHLAAFAQPPVTTATQNPQETARPASTDTKLKGQGKLPPEVAESWKDRIDNGQKGDGAAGQKAGRNLYAGATLYTRYLFENGFVELGGPLSEYVRKVSDRLAPFAKAPNVRVHISHWGTANSWCLPDGTVFLHADLLARMTSEEELAFVLAHEMSHNRRRHAATERVRFPTGARVGFMGRDYNRLKYSRDVEFQADADALRAMLEAGYDGSGAIRALETLGRLDTTPIEPALNHRALLMLPEWPSKKEKAMVDSLEKAMDSMKEVRRERAQKMRENRNRNRSARYNDNDNNDDEDNTPIKVVYDTAYVATKKPTTTKTDSTSSFEADLDSSAVTKDTKDTKTDTAQAPIAMDESDEDMDSEDEGDEGNYDDENDEDDEESIDFEDYSPHRRGRYTPEATSDDRDSHPEVKRRLAAIKYMLEHGLPADSTTIATLTPSETRRIPLNAIFRDSAAFSALILQARTEHAWRLLEMGEHAPALYESLKLYREDSSANRAALVLQSLLGLARTGDYFAGRFGRSGQSYGKGTAWKPLLKALDDGTEATYRLWAYTFASEFEKHRPEAFAHSELWASAYASSVELYAGPQAGKVAFQRAAAAHPQGAISAFFKARAR